MTKKTHLSILSAALLLATQAGAWDKTISVPANRTSGIAEFAVSSTDCYMSTKPKMTLPTKPSHGSVTFKWVASRLGKSAARCKGMPLHLMQAYYTPDRGFRGTDSFKIGMGYPKYMGTNIMIYDTQDVNIEVK